MGARTFGPRHSVSFEDLRSEAEWMDAVAEPELCRCTVMGRTYTYAAAQGGSKWRTDSQPGADSSGMLHLIGMVGSGKSSLFTVLAVYLARRGQRVVIVQGDVASLLHWHCSVCRAFKV